MSVLTPTVCGLGGWRAVSQIPSEILAEIQARSASRTAQTSQAPPPAEMTTILNPDQSEAGGAGGSVPPCAAAPPSAADTSLLQAVHAAAASIVQATPATSAPLPPALDGVAAASGVAQGAGGGEDTSRAEASAGNGRNTSTPLENAFAGVAGVGADVHSADDAVGNPLMNASTRHCEGVSGQELVQDKTAGTAVPPTSHASQAGDHSPSQINPPQSATGEGRFPDMSQHARVEERDRRLNELKETYDRKKRELVLEYRNLLTQLNQDYNDLPPVNQSSYTYPSPSDLRDADTLQP